MKSRFFIPLLFVAAGLFVSCNDENDDETNDAIVEGIIQKAQNLKENTYVVQAIGAEEKTFPLSQEESQWYIGRSYTDRTQQAIKVNLMDEDPEQSTMGWGMFELPLETANQLTTIDQTFYNKFAWSYGKFGTFRTGKEVTVHMGKGGNVKLNGSSRIWLKERAGTKGYSGQYQFLFAFVFEATVWDSETRTEVPDGEYIMYGNAIIEEYFPELNYFSILPPTDWVKVGSSIKLDADWSDGADFDWSKVKLIGQTLGHGSSDDVDEGYFSWDAQTQTLTSVKSANNNDVYLKFAYEGTDMKTSCQIATGEGWDYTSFTLSPEYLVMGDWAYLPVSVKTYAPTNMLWHNECLEVDPESDPDENFYYYNGYMGKYSPKPGNYNIRLRVKSNHDVGCIIPIRVVEGETPSSFQILPEQGSTVGYSMGLELSVRTSPEDCYWNWADVELMPEYADDLIFTGNGGRDDHPKLRTSKSHDPAVMGVQVGFRLKYDHRKTCYIYVTLD